MTPRCPLAGPVLAFVYAVKELLEECKSGGTCLPANVVFLIEGEEENVSPWGVFGSAAQGLLRASCAAAQCSQAGAQISSVNPGLLVSRLDHQHIPPTLPTVAQGSTGFREAVQQNLRWFEGARLVLISNTLWVGERLPCITCEH